MAKELIMDICEDVEGMEYGERYGERYYDPRQHDGGYGERRGYRITEDDDYGERRRMYR